MARCLVAALLILSHFAGAAPVGHNLRAGDLLFVHRPTNVSDPLSRAIEATGLATVRWLEAHGRHVLHKDTAAHVAMVVNATTIVQAASDVELISVENWWSSYAAAATVFVGALPSAGEAARGRAVQWALGKVGEPYAENFQPPTLGRESFYCSSLVDYAYRFAFQRQLVFTDIEFPLQWEPRDFWERYYRGLNQTIPQYNGSNPTLLLQSAAVTYSKFSAEVLV
mmetsp:Transcript_12128/g.22877  ORF Transcript_12128/g.22877 Transcript_12128/m.22877 type:complete len:225 (+) Transcript_12128:64-738(+)